MFDDMIFSDNGEVCCSHLERAWLNEIGATDDDLDNLSTLTMQLAKNTYNHSERTFVAKFTEMALARRIESTYDKETILKCYLNRVFWGHTFLGLKQAAYGYFDKLPRDLTVGEAGRHHLQPEPVLPLPQPLCG